LRFFICLETPFVVTVAVVSVVVVSVVAVVVVVTIIIEVKVFVGPFSIFMKTKIVKRVIVTMMIRETIIKFLFRFDKHLEELFI
jgi:hypothetical protein